MTPDDQGMEIEWDHEGWISALAMELEPWAATLADIRSLPESAPR